MSRKGNRFYVKLNLHITPPNGVTYKDMNSLNCILYKSVIFTYSMFFSKQTVTVCQSYPKNTGMEHTIRIIQIRIQ